MDTVRVHNASADNAAGSAPPVGFISSLLRAYLESIAFVADAAERLTDTISVSDPCAGTASAGGVIRNSLDMVRAATMSVNDDLVEARHRFARFVDLRNWDARTYAATEAAFEPSSQEPAPLDASSLAVTARRYLRRLPGQVATLSGLLGYLRKHSKLDDEALEQVIRQQFDVVGDDLVFLRPPGSSQHVSNKTLDAAEAQLSALGYEDLRRDVGLVRLPDDRRRAAAVAFQHDRPVVLVFLCTDAVLDDPLIAEQARVMARSLSVAGPQAKFVLLRGQSASAYLDADSGEWLDSLPAAAQVQP